MRAAREHAYGKPGEATTLVSLPEPLGVIGAYEWHRKGIDIAASGARLHPAYGVFAPTRDEYVDLVAQAPLPYGIEHPVVFDIGTGTGVLAAVLARRGAREVPATDINPRACGARGRTCNGSVSPGSGSPRPISGPPAGGAPT
ncbi:50S ribosomal protein L11 methyltransferase [Amycolatopsis sp.]|uniref:50S ribosomal protein L11 methyltransferase n=1 Tax=Amycolatopsis sp. TaxID=37632 RepID=UPI002C41A884|nr:50S ribosomal protein L11 methyltransferase [Amycolatopsis sp.]HVV14109.1 50S ribosomal protein L11 methyltransferase [Amycolatopsis sp.]